MSPPPTSPLPEPPVRPVGLAPLMPTRPRIPPATPTRSRSPRHGKATIILLLTTALWGLSFPLTKSLQAVQLTTLVPGASTWFLAAVALVFRFGLASGVLALITAPTLRKLSRSEIRQGIGLGSFGAAGLFLQFDGLNYTTASTSAFLTGCFCVIVPVFVALEHRRWPPGRVVGCCGLVVAGMAVLSGVDPRDLRLGRGEGETVCSAVFFAAQIWWLERPAFRANRTGHATLVMFAVTAALGAVALVANSPGGAPAREFAAACTGWPAAGLLLTLTVLCTLCTFTLMNHWQKHLEATEAGLIYCVEPVFTSLFTLFLPARLAVLTSVPYANEQLTTRLLVGGALITLANLAIQLKPAR